ncbi:hypothetical protein DL98DRAFT_522818 [Cadophora sp. DSE1049]|nr:hypothetical protein DL98DRAFT_522818 [Cadophora sp. DSE1049]
MAPSRIQVPDDVLRMTLCLTHATLPVLEGYVLQSFSDTSGVPSSNAVLASSQIALFHKCGLYCLFCPSHLAYTLIILNIDVTEGYAFALGGILSILLLAQLLPYIDGLVKGASLWIKKHLIYPYAQGRGAEPQF